MKRIIGSALVIGLLSGCMTPPKHHTIENRRTYNESYDQVWSRLIAFLAQRNIPLKEIAKDSGVIYAEALRFDPGQADCGSPGILKPIARIANINILVQQDNGQQLVSVNGRFVETRYNSLNYSSSQFECSSNGVVEKGILDAIGVAAKTSAPAYSTSVSSGFSSPSSQGQSVDVGKTREQKINELMNTPGLSYEEYQRRYREITAGQ